VIRDSITILKGISKIFVNRDMNENTIFLVIPAENSKPSSGGTITTDRCITHRGIVAFNFSPRNLTQVTSAMEPVQDSMVGFSSVKRITLREGLY